MYLTINITFRVELGCSKKVRSAKKQMAQNFGARRLTNTCRVLLVLLMLSLLLSSSQENLLHPWQTIASVSRTQIAVMKRAHPPPPFELENRDFATNKPPRDEHQNRLWQAPAATAYQSRQEGHEMSNFRPHERHKLLTPVVIASSICETFRVTKMCFPRVTKRQTLNHLFLQNP